MGAFSYKGLLGGAGPLGVDCRVCNLASLSHIYLHQVVWAEYSYS